MQRDNAPTSITLPQIWSQDHSFLYDDEDSTITPKAVATNGANRQATTPGFGIGIATPMPNGLSHGTREVQTHLPATAEEEFPLEKRPSQSGQPRTSSEKPVDYFSGDGRPKSSETSSNEDVPAAANNPELSSQYPADNEREEKAKEGSSLFGKKFRMNFPKKLGGRNSTDTKPTIVDEKAEESDRSDDRDGKTIQDNLHGIVQKIRHQYGERLHQEPDQPLTPGMAPSSLAEMPMLRLPLHTTVIIQEEQPDSGGVADLYRGTVDALGKDTDLIEKVAPQWLGELLLRNRLPVKEISKVSFILMPYQDKLPGIASSDGNNRLNANRMLRAKKILAYVAERIETLPEEPDPEALKPEEYLELYCHEQVYAKTHHECCI